MPEADHLANSTPVFQWGFIVKIGDLPGAFVQSVSMPKIANTVIEIPCKNRIMTCAGLLQHEQVSVVLRNFQDSKVISSLVDWYHQIILESGDLGYPQSYKKDGEIEILGSDLSGVEVIRLEGCWPSQIELGEGDYSGQDLLLSTVTLEVDNVIV